MFNTLRMAIDGDDFIVAPGVYDALSAKIADQAGFSALYLTGYGVCASYLGVADAGLLNFTDMVNRVYAITDCIDTPLIADADTGFGGVLNVRQAVRGFERAGAQAIQIEDQEFPKQCGHVGTASVISKQDMIAKVKVAVDSRQSEDMLVIARTDALKSMGMSEALDRAAAYHEAGADIIFVEAPQTKEQLAAIGQQLKMPLVVNMVEGGKTPILEPDELAGLGFKIALYPGSGMASAAAALSDIYSHLKMNGTSVGASQRLYGSANGEPSFHVLSGMVEALEFEQNWAG